MRYKNDAYMGCCIPKRVVRGVVIGAIVANFSYRDGKTIE